MNGYFWLFAIWALCITPISAQVSVRIGNGVHYRVRLQAAGLPVMKRAQDGKEDQEEKLDGRKAVKGVFALDGPVLGHLLREGHLGRALGAWHVQSVYVHARISQQDAAQTALFFALARTVMSALFKAPSVRRKLSAGIKADYQAQGSEVFIRCILTARLGNLVWEAARFAAAIHQIRIREEDQYAASH